MAAGQIRVAPEGGANEEAQKGQTPETEMVWETPEIGIGEFYRHNFI